MGSKDLRYETLNTQAYEYLYNQILHGKIPPGHRVVEQKIVEETGISRSPIREAIRQLAIEGLVVVHPRGGVRVYRATASDLQYLFECRLSLEPNAAYYAAQRITDLQRFEFDQLMEDMNKAVVQKEIEQIRVLSNRFHSLIVEMSGNPYIVKMMKQLYSLMTLYRNVILDIPQRIELGAIEHQNIWVAIREQNAPDAKRLMKKHLEQDYEYYSLHS